jgi:hypothetical protein
MSRLRYTLAQLMVIVLYVGLGFAAPRDADEFWASATYTLAVIMITTAVVGALVRRGRARAYWTGFAVFGWSYVLVAQLPDWPIGAGGGGPLLKPNILIEWGIMRLQSYFDPQFMMRTNWQDRDQVIRSLAIIFFGLMGAVLGRFLAVKDDRPSP